MSREAHIPLALWICAAVVAHLAGGESAVQVAQTVMDRASIRAAVRAERATLRPADTVFELLNAETLPSPGQNMAAPEHESEAEADPADDEASKETAEAKRKKKEDPKVENQPPPPEPEKKKDEPPLPLVTTPMAALPPPPPDKKLLIKQNDENAEDNKNSKRASDEGNTVAEESVARIRAHDQDAPKPTAGHKAGPTKGPMGDSDQTKIAQSEEKKGSEKAPGENKRDATDGQHSSPGRPSPPEAPAANGPPASVRGSGGGRVASAAGGPASPPPSPGGAGPSSPEAAGNRGNWSIDPANPGGDGRSRVPGRRRPLVPFQSPVRVDAVGLNGQGTPGAPNINLTTAGVEKAVGSEKLKQERAADGAARRSAHIGSNGGNKWEQMKAAIENYEPSVKEGNTTALNAARVPFASYLNNIHNRIHPIFADENLEALDRLSRSDPMNQNNIVTHVEIVLAKETGSVVRAGVVKHSGSTAFDAIALQSVHRAAPFGRAPDVIVSPDGKVYLHWEFHRNRFDACTTRNARPIMLKNAPVLKPSSTGAPPRKPTPTSPDERPRDAPGPLRPLRE